MPCAAKLIEMSRAAKLKETTRFANLIRGARRPGPLISAPLRARFRITWISPLLAEASRAFPLLRGYGGRRPPRSAPFSLPPPPPHLRDPPPPRAHPARP